MRVRWTEQAAENLEAIFDYVSLTSPLYAGRLVDGILDRIAMASLQPQAGRSVKEIERDDTRELIERPYRIIYRITHDTLHVLAIVHTRREFDRLRDTVREGQDVVYATAG